MTTAPRIPDTRLLLLPAMAMFLVFLVIPLTLFFLIGFNPPDRGIIRISDELTLENFIRFFTTPNFLLGLRNSVILGLLSVVICLILGYPLAYLIARTTRPRVFLVLSILVLAAMQLDMTIRLYGIMTIFGNNNGLINQALDALGLPKVPFLYNLFGVTVGTVQFALPFMIFTLIGVLRNIDPSFEQAARSLGATEWAAFRDVFLPLSMPGIVAGSVIVFAIGVSGYIVPTLLGSSRIPTLATHLYQQINDMGFWQFGAAIGFILFAVSLTAIAVVYRISARYVAGGRA